MGLWFDVAIGISLIFVIFSAVCSSIQELVAWALELRAKTLRIELGRLLGDPNADAIMRSLLGHPLVKQLYRPVIGKRSESDFPSYIPRGIFGAAMVDILAGAAATEAVPALLDKLAGLDQASRDGALVRALAAALAPGEAADDAAGSLARAAADAANADSRAKVLALTEGLPHTLLRTLLVELLGGGAAPARQLDAARRIVRFVRVGPSVERVRQAVAATSPSTARNALLACFDATGERARSRAAERVEAVVVRGGAGVTALQGIVASLPDGQHKEAIGRWVAEGDAALRQAAQLDLQQLVEHPADELRHAVELMGKDSETGRVLSAILDRSVRTVAGAREKLERWFDQGMEHCTASYKRKSQVALLVIAAVVVGSFNVDAVRIIGTLANDAAVRGDVVSIARDWARAHPSLEGDAPGAVNGVAAGAEEAPTADIGEQTKRFAEKLEQVALLPVPLGWPSDPLVTSRAPVTGLGVVTKIVGLLLSIAALSLGAPFWFSMLNRFVSLRPTGRPPSHGSKDEGDK